MKKEFLGDGQLRKEEGSAINQDKLSKYLAEEMIWEFASAEECMEYFNTFDSQKFQSVEEMKAFQGEYGFGIGGKWYHVNYQEALDVWEDASLDAKLASAAERSGKTSASVTGKEVEREF